MMVGEPGTGYYLPVVACNDTLTDQQVRYRLWDADSRETLSSGEIVLPANQNWQVDLLRTFASDARMILIEWEVDGQKYGNHYLAGNPPVSLDRYRGWLDKIASLPRVFDSSNS